ncbi:tetratricopeptide repeat protein [Sphingobacterium paramultivorum]|uniref:tetratricopeptide repeat protein n=1 Tax=Sphingobacterium paramultivorum TaxID=2886510 RepID=UPI00129CF6B9|nr:tetratricopeptide repeat protein [Sphingobacterium paramultivorum]
MKIVSSLLLLLVFSSGCSQTKQEAIIEKYLKNGAYRYHYTLQGWEDNINKALQKDSTIAILWQNKALPYWKMKKYDLALQCYNKAVFYDRESYLGRRGYLKCIFQKDYTSAIADMEMAEKEFGYGYQNDHSYQFYISLCYLQQNNFEKAAQILTKDFEKTIKDRGENWIHFLDLFYMGIIQYELRNYNKAILYFDKSLREYVNFSDAKYYKGLCLLQKKDAVNAEKLMREAKVNAEQGFTITEDDSFYESFPYKVNWHMAKWTIPNYVEN